MAQPTGPEQFNPTWITAVVALAALIRPELNRLYRRLFQPASIDPIETGFVEVGHGPMGPTVALLGTLYGRHAEQAVRRIDLTITRERDRSVHEFEWLAFRGRGMAITDDGSAPMEFPTTIVLLPQQPHRYHIIFVDRDLRDDYLQRGQALRGEWQEYWRSKSAANADGTITGADIGQTFNQFYAENRLLPYYNWFDRSFYWQAGAYVLEMRISALGRRQFSKRWRFNLSDGDIESLRSNTYKILRATCELPNLPWSYALAKYLTDTAPTPVPSK